MYIAFLKYLIWYQQIIITECIKAYMSSDAYARRKTGPILNKDLSPVLRELTI